MGDQMTLPDRDKLFAALLALLLPEKSHIADKPRNVTREVIKTAARGGYRKMFIPDSDLQLPLAFTSSSYFGGMITEIRAAWDAAYGELNPNILFEDTTAGNAGRIPNSEIYRVSPGT